MSRFRNALLAALCLTFSAMAGEANLLKNPGFEDARSTPWYVGPCSAIDNAIAHAGRQSFRAGHQGGREKKDYASLQRVAVNQTAAEPLKISLWHKGEGVDKLEKPDNYSILVQVKFADDDHDWKIPRIHLPAGTHDWQYSELIYVPAKPVAELYL